MDPRYPVAFVKGLHDRGFDAPTATLNRILSLDEERRATIQKLQEAQARRNAASKEIGQAKAKKDEASAKGLMDEVAALKGAIQQGEADEKRLDDELRNLLAAIPNMPAADVPVGADAERQHGAPQSRRRRKKFAFQPKQHFELGEALGLMDFETAAKLSGARFVVLKGALARLERALAQFMLDLHTSEHGYTEITPPLLVRDDTMFGTGQLPKFSDDQFATSDCSTEDSTSSWIRASCSVDQRASSELQSATIDRGRTEHRSSRCCNREPASSSADVRLPES